MGVRSCQPPSSLFGSRPCQASESAHELWTAVLGPPTEQMLDAGTYCGTSSCIMWLVHQPKLYGKASNALSLWVMV